MKRAVGEAGEKMQCHRQQVSGSIAGDGGKLALLTSKCPSHTSKGFLPLSRLCTSAAARPVLSSLLVAASSASPPQWQLENSEHQLADPSEPSRTAKLPPRRTFLESTVDRNGYLCSPRAARELAFSILYAALLLDKKPMRVFRDRLKQQSGYLGKELLASYKHTPENGDSITLEDVSTMKRLEGQQLKESLIEAAVLSASPAKVYSRSILMLAQKIVQVTEDSWSELHIIKIDLVPKQWKDGYSAAAQQCILHMSMAEMTRCGTPPKVVINEAVEIGKRFLDTHSARIINGCLGKFMRSEYFKESQSKYDHHQV